MSHLLHVGDIVYTERGEPCEIREFIGGGGQGEVFAARLESRDVAVKWYGAYQHYDPELLPRLRRAIERSAPSERFLWPLAIVTSPERANFGYVMRLRPHRFRSMADLEDRKVNPSFRALARAGRELAEALWELHSGGFYYCDVNRNNVFFDPTTGEVRICDNDNVEVDGVPGGVKGTAGFMAPEVARGDALPNNDSDRFSLAVLLFRMLHNHHPLEGRREYECMDLTPSAMYRLHAADPLFIFDPDDDSNHPVEGAQDNPLIFWYQVYPQFLCRTFTQAFTDGLRDPRDGRVRESEWRGVLARLQDCVFQCPRCESENFYDEEQLQNHGRLKDCWSCATPPTVPLRLRLQNKNLETFLGSGVVVLEPGVKLYRHHVDSHVKALFDFSVPVAEVTRKPNRPEQLGLTNLTAASWQARGENGKKYDIAPGQTIALLPGLHICFGAVSAQVRC